MPSPITFNPSPELTQVLLERLNSPNYSLTQIAADHDTTLEALVLWATRPDIVERQRAIKSFAAERARSAAVSQLHVCVEALATTLHAYMKDELNLAPATNSESAHTRDRLRTGARRASWHIQRIARDHPELVPSALLNVIPAREQPRADSPLRRLAPQPPLPDLSQLSALFAAFLAHSGMDFSQSRRVEDSPWRGDQPMSSTASPPTPSSSPPPTPIPSSSPPSVSGVQSPRRPSSAISARDSASSAIVSPSEISNLKSEISAPDLVPRSDFRVPTSEFDRPSDSATEILSARSFSDAPLTDPHGPNLAHSAANYRGVDPAVAFTDPYVIPQSHIDRLEKAGRRRPPLSPAPRGRDVEVEDPPRRALRDREGALTSATTGPAP